MWHWLTNTHESITSPSRTSPFNDAIQQMLLKVETVKCGLTDVVTELGTVRLPATQTCQRQLDSITQVTWLVVTEVRSGLVTECRHEIGVQCAVSHIFAYWTSLTVAHLIFFTVECGIARFLCAMRVFEVRASSSSSRLPLCQISFLSRPPWLS